LYLKYDEIDFGTGDSANLFFCGDSIVMLGYQTYFLGSLGPPLLLPFVELFNDEDNWG
jgi:hypothetical protein